MTLALASACGSAESAVARRAGYMLEGQLRHDALDTDGIPRDNQHQRPAGH